MKILRIILLFAAIFTLAACSSPSNNYQPTTTSGVIWGTTYNITYNGADASKTILSTLNHVSAIANAYDHTSEIAILNATGQLNGASTDFISLLDAARRLSAMTNGAFDPTIGPIVDLWGFGAGSTSNDSVTDNEIARRLALTGMKNIIVNKDTVKLATNGARLDFAAFAKGYGVDCIAIALDNAQINDYMVEIGGEMRTKGKNPQGRPWRIQIDAPIPSKDGSHTRLAVLQLNDHAVATSGNYRNFYLNDKGKIVGHTISPITGRPAETDLLSVTIVARDAMTADALATACMVLGKDKASQLIRRLIDDSSTGIRGALLVTQGKDNDTYSITDINLTDIIL